MSSHINRITAIILITLINFISQSEAHQKDSTTEIRTLSDNSILISYDFPDKLRPGEEHVINVTMLNNGKNKWKKSDNYHLSLYDEFDNLYESDVWGIRNVPLPYDINSGEKISFFFKITAPEKSGKFNCSWIMKKDSVSFGLFAAAFVNVHKDSADDLLTDKEFRSQFVNLSVPFNMTAGVKYKVSVTVKNTGTSLWYSAAGGDFKLAPVNDSSSVLFPDWNSTPVYLSNTIDTGQTSAIEFEVTAPMTSGKYSLQWMMKKGEYFFGQKTSKVLVYVSKNSIKSNDPRENNSAFLEQNIPNSMYVNEDHNVSVTMVNTGNKTWIKGNEQLVMVDTEKRLTTLNAWGVGYIQLPDNVEPGKTVTFKFKVRPRETGWQFFQMIMMDDDGMIFGDPSKSVEIIVSGK